MNIDEKQKCNLLNALILGQALTSHSLFVLSLFCFKLTRIQFIIFQAQMFAHYI